MPQPDLSRLSETLLRGGIAPKHVRRYLAELRDHADDLMQGGATQDAAWAQLGSEDHLAQQMLARRELRSLGARHPIPFFGFGPLIVLLLSFLVVVLALAAVVSAAMAMYGVASASELSQAAYDSMMSYRGVFEAAAWAAKYPLPVLVAAWFVALAVKQRAALPWVVFGVALIAIVGGASDLSFVWPAERGAQGELQIGFGWFPPFPSMDNSLFRAAVNFGLVAPALVWLRYLRTSHAR